MLLTRLARFTSLASLIATGVPTSAAEALQPPAKLTVRVYNFAQVPAGTLVASEETAAWIFRQTGIEVRWVDCPISAQDIAKFPACSQTTTLPSARSVKILPRPMADRFGLSPVKFGIAVPPNHAFVFFQRVQEATKDTGFSRPRVLGHVIAHELGHLLLPGEEHAAEGIMAEDLLARDCEHPGVMLLHFTAEQAERMRSQCCLVGPTKKTPHPTASPSAGPSSQ
jgi:hypothetical protein